MNVLVIDHDQALGEVAAVIVLQWAGGTWTLQHVPMKGAIPLPRRWTSRALRQLADEFDAQADLVGD